MALSCVGTPSAERMFGYDAAEMIGQPITRLFPPDLVKEEKRILERLPGSASGGTKPSA